MRGNSHEAAHHAVTSLSSDPVRIRLKYIPQHHIVTHPQLMFLPQRESQFSHPHSIKHQANL